MPYSTIQTIHLKVNPCAPDLLGCLTSSIDTASYIHLRYPIHHCAPLLLGLLISCLKDWRFTLNVASGDMEVKAPSSNWGRCPLSMRTLLTSLWSRVVFCFPRALLEMLQDYFSPQTADSEEVLVTKSSWRYPKQRERRQMNAQRFPSDPLVVILGEMAKPWFQMNLG